MPLFLLENIMEYKLVLDQQLVDEYNAYYHKTHPRSKKDPIDKPRHPQMNTWMILRRNSMNALKQRWKDFGVWWIKKLGYNGLKLDKFEMTFTTYMNSRRRSDCDNTCPKFILDSFTEAGFIVDDDYKHLQSLTLKMGYDKENPRTEIIVKCID